MRSHRCWHPVFHQQRLKEQLAHATAVNPVERVILERLAVVIDDRKDMGRRVLYGLLITAEITSRLATPNPIRRDAPLA